ncbi:amidohydrolase family protein [Nocardia sp. NPDC057227]|uniref:amidohydrolase family protein n=1 Tax=Nocardia sp. NPDC057227 TaxID=3346056 RepID=UPI00363F3D60
MTELLDFHAHFRPPWWREIAPANARTGGPFALLDDTEELLRFTREGGVSHRVLGAPVDLLFGPGEVPREQLDRVNEHLAGLVAAHAPLLGGLGTVNAFAGADGAEQVRDAVGRLGLAGIVIDSARDGVSVGAPVTRPTLEAAAELRVPVFVHPVFAPDTAALEATAGAPGVSFGRGFTNGIALLTLLHHGVTDDLPKLDLVFTSLGTGALLFAADHLAGRQHRIHIDTLRLNPAALRYQIDVLGADRVVLGTDWPIRTDGTRRDVTAFFDAAELDSTARALVGGDNARRLFARAAEG